MVQNLILQRTILTENHELEGGWYKKIFVGSFVIEYLQDYKSLDWNLKHIAWEKYLLWLYSNTKKINR